MTVAADRLLVFETCGFRYALPLGEIAEVVDLNQGFPIPRAPLFFAGAISFHGRIVAVVDLASLLKVGEAPQGGKLVVLDAAVADLALAVGAAVDIVPADTILEEEEGDNPLVARKLFMADGEVEQLAVERLLDLLEEGLAG